RPIDVEPQHRRRWGKPKCAAVEAATEVQDHRIGMTGDKIDTPVVELLGAQRDQILVAGRQRCPMYALEVIVDAVHRLRSRVIPQNGVPRTAFICTQVQGDQIRPFHRAPTDRTEINFRSRHVRLLPTGSRSNSSFTGHDSPAKAATLNGFRRQERLPRIEFEIPDNDVLGSVGSSSAWKSLAAAAIPCWVPLTRS